MAHLAVVRAVSGAARVPVRRAASLGSARALSMWVRPRYTEVIYSSANASEAVGHHHCSRCVARLPVARRYYGDGAVESGRAGGSADDVEAARRRVRVFLASFPTLDLADALRVANSVISWAAAHAVVPINLGQQKGAAAGPGPLELGLATDELYEIAIALLGSHALGMDKNVASDAETAAGLAFPLLQLLSESSDDAKYSLATLLALGRGCERDVETAADIFKALARTGHLQATFNLARLFADGTGVPQSTTRAIGLYEHCGNHGLPLGLTAVGNLYKEGRLVDQDYTEAMRWFKRAASAGCMQAHVALGHMLTHGHGVEKDLEASLRHLRIAAEAGVAIAQHNVATCYQTGKGCEVDLDKARHYYELAANQGLIFSLINLGNMYNTGFGVDIDYEKAKEFYSRAAPHSADARGLLDGVIEKIKNQEGT